jgi:NitT/TauT family transport system substrate-binding protein
LKGFTVKSSLRIRTAAVIAVALIAAAGCDSSGNKGTQANAANKPADKVAYLTGFGSFGREAEVWVADKKGFFKDQNIEVTISAGAAGDSNTKLLEADKAQFAIVDFGTLLQQVGTGSHTDIRALAAIQQRTVSSVIALQGKGITTPKDLAGKKIGAAPGSVLQAMFPGYAQLAGIDPKSVTFVPGSPTDLPGFLAKGQVDALLQYLVGAPAISAAAQGAKTVVLPYSDYLADPYGSVLITTTKMINTNPDLVKRFTTALMKGLEYAVNNPTEAGDILHAAVPQTVAAPAAQELTLMKQYVLGTDAGKPVGSFDQARVARAIASLQSLNLFPAGLTPDKVIAFDLTPKA